MKEACDTNLNLVCYGMLPSRKVVPLQHEETCTAFFRTWTMPQTCRWNPCERVCSVGQSYDPKHLTWVKHNNDDLGERKIGVTCNARRDVSSIDMTYFGLTGTLPAALFRQKDLESLWLGANNFIGEIPGAIMTDLPHLKSVDLSFNNFSLHRVDAKGERSM